MAFHEDTLGRLLLTCIIILLIVIGVTIMCQDSNQYHEKLLRDATAAINLMADDKYVPKEQVLDSLETLSDLVNDRIIEVTKDMIE